jgi:hypothetical protein
MPELISEKDDEYYAASIMEGKLSGNPRIRPSDKYLEKFYKDKENKNDKEVD